MSYLPKLSVLSLSLFLAACNFAPKYEQPQAPIAAEYKNSQTAGVSAAQLGWQDFFQDARLKVLIQIALENNRDLRIATENVAQAQAAYRIDLSNMLPKVGLTGQQQAQEYPADMNISGQRQISRSYVAGLGLNSFELDFWGKIRNNNEAALQNFYATEQAQRAAHIAVVSSVANTYFSQRALQETRNLVARTVDSYQSTVDLVKARFKAGVASMLEVNQARSTLDTAKATLAQVERQLGQADNALTLLLGQSMPTDLPAAAAFGADVVKNNIPAGLPSELLTHRPDIIAAEHQLKAANANIGAARAAFFPSISLTAMFGMASLELGQLFDKSRDAWNFTPSISMPIFAGGALKNSLDAAKIGKNIQIANYEKTIQVAFKEVNDALVGEKTYKDQLDALRQQQAAAYQTLDLATVRYKAGVDSFLQVQSAQIALLSVQQNFLGVGLESLHNKVNLYKALGGGWSTADLQKTTEHK